MAALFPPWSNSPFRAALAAGVLLAIVLPVAAIAWARTPYATGQNEPLSQPIQFDHRHHVLDAGIDCLYCHSGATRSAYAGVPPTSLCMGCHGQVWAQSPELAPLRASWIARTPVVWARVTSLPEHVYFDHSIHLKKGVGCVTCHGRVDQMGRVYQVMPLTMSWCLDCHRDPEARLRPLDKLTDMAWAPDRAPREVGREIARAQQVRAVTDCTGCHR